VAPASPVVPAAPVAPAAPLVPATPVAPPPDVPAVPAPMTPLLLHAAVDANATAATRSQLSTAAGRRGMVG